MLTQVRTGKQASDFLASELPLASEPIRFSALLARSFPGGLRDQVRASWRSIKATTSFPRRASTR